MKYSKWVLGATAAISALVMGMAGAPALATPQPSAPAGPPGPAVKLIVAQRNITVPRYGKRVYLDPGVYVGALQRLQFDVQRANYAQPLQLSQVINLSPGSQEVRVLPHRLAPTWRGLARFTRVTVKNSSGKIIASRIIPFCPDSGSAQRTGPNSPPRINSRSSARRTCLNSAMSGGCSAAGQSIRLRSA